MKWQMSDKYYETFNNFDNFDYCCLSGLFVAGIPYMFDRAGLDIAQGRCTNDASMLIQMQQN